jgi:4-amino-4-deoxy-L-arabinose transferase-like glycosyltransferase
VAAKTAARCPGRRELVTFLAILFVALALRLYGLGTGLWYDEILTYVHFARLPLGEIITTYDDQNQHFLYSILAHMSFLVFGEDAWSFRLPAVIFGLASIVALYLFGREVGTSRESLLASAWLAFSYHHIWFSQNARGYIGLLFWTVLSSWLLVLALRENQLRLWVVYAVAVALGTYTHTTMLFVVAGQFVVYVRRLFGRREQPWHSRWAGFLFGFVLAGLISLTLYSLVFPQMFGGLLTQGAEQAAAVAAWKNPLWSLSELISNLEISLAGKVTGVLVMALFVTGLWSFKNENPIILYLMLIPVLVCALTMKAIGHPIWPRLFFFNIGFASLVLVRGTTVLGGRARGASIGTILCAGLIVLSVISIPSVYAPKQDYAGALKYVDENYEQGDRVVTVGPVATFPYKYFYNKNWETVETVQDLDAIRSHANRTWLLYSMPLHVEASYPELISAIKREFKIVKQFYGTVGGGTIFVWRSDSVS